MSSFRMRARRIAFGDSNEDLSDNGSDKSSVKSRSSTSSKRGVLRQSSSISEQCVCPLHEKSLSVARKRTNRVRRLNRSQGFEHFVEALENDGCVIVEDFVNPQISQRVTDAEEAVSQAAEAETTPQSPVVDVNSLVRESLVSDSLFRTLASHFLTLETVSWQDKQPELRVAKPKLSTSETVDLNDNSLSTDGSRFSFHRADSIHHVRHPAARKYDYQSRRDASLGLLLPEIDSLSASVNISTVPGSHLWDDQKPDFSKGVVEVQLRGGDAMILLGSLYHRLGASSSNTSIASKAESGTPKEKLMHEVWMCSGVYSPASEITAEDEV